MRLLPPYCHRCGGSHNRAVLCKSARTGGIDWVAIMAYQIKPGQEMTLKEIGDLAGCSRERIRQIEFAALKKLAARGMVRDAVTEALTA